MGTELVELRFDEVLEEQREKEDLQDPGELYLVWVCAVVKGVIPFFFWLTITIISCND